MIFVGAALSVLGVVYPNHPLEGNSSLVDVAVGMRVLVRQILLQN